jgi:predicted phage-related endonuclease
MELRGEIEPEIVDTEAVEWGLRLESSILQKYEESENNWLEYGQTSFVHPGYNYMRAKPDGYNSEQKAIVDAKNLNGYVLKEWQDEGISQLYLVQQHYYAAIMNACGIPVENIHLAVLFAGQHYECFKTPYDDEIGQAIINNVKDFYEKYIIGNAPLDDLMVNADCTILESYYKKSNGTEIALQDDHVGHALKEYVRIRDELMFYKKAKEENKAIIQLAMGEASKGVWVGENNKAIKVSWGDVSKTYFDIKRFESENPEIYKKYSKESSYRALKVTEKDLTKKIKGE